MSMTFEMKTPKHEDELRILLDKMYKHAKEKSENRETISFKKLVDLIGIEPVITTAIHNIKSNSGSRTPGTDGETIERFLLANHQEVLDYVKEKLRWYKPKPVRRKWIDKPGKNEKRPLGIPAIGDRVIQECVRIVIEPILEAQFFKHSYGFRPMRDTHQALGRLNEVIHSTGYKWVIEGDISKFFDKVNHNILLKKLWGMGIHDSKLLMIIKEMLKAGVSGESSRNELGTPQGGIISPLLANVYLHSLDKFVSREWEEKKFLDKNGEVRKYAHERSKFYKLHKSNLKPAYFIRYADDWVLVTNSRENAEKWKYKIAKFLENNLQIELSRDKTKITNVSKTNVKFLGFDIKFVRGKANKGLVPDIRPNKEKLKLKMKEVRKATKLIKKQATIEQAIHQINLVNSKVRGLAEYYKAANNVNISMKEYSASLKFTALRSIKRWGGKLERAKFVDNLKSVHEKYRTQIPTIEYNGLKIGITNPAFATWQGSEYKNPLETPYSMKGRDLYEKRTGKVPLKRRSDWLLSVHLSRIIGFGLTDPKYNFEYYMNRAYAFNRDKGKCKVCGKEVSQKDVEIHHNSPKKPLDKVNKVKELSTLHMKCHDMIHSKIDFSHLGKKTWDKILKYRNLLLITN